VKLGLGLSMEPPLVVFGGMSLIRQTVDDCFDILTFDPDIA